MALTVADIERRRAVFVAQGRLILALDGLQPDVGHEVLCEVLCGEVLLARSLLSATEADLTALLQEATAALPVQVAGVVSDGQHAIRNALSCGAARCSAPALSVPLVSREAAQPVYAADRHANKELKKRVAWHSAAGAHDRGA